MKPTLCVFAFLAAFSLNSWAQEVDYDKRNMHIFCASHLAVISDTLDEQKDEYKALTFMSGVHRDEAREMGATEKHFDDVVAYLKKARKNNKPKWNKLTSQSRNVCFPQS
ncbi:hypothetical protein [Marinobacter algicola]|uniref:Uncharacterized protein n=1 Tax=Marinobacter algicola DG893 TaxID=443152 RepID=A6F365_9GAMM|nr:hypothetical protein [Marinobacter algicola]EDM46793.1 hypothetical protein MDG893_08975 [Marinobacter algicola DG893]